MAATALPQDRLIARLIALAWLALASLPAQAADNPLLGSWRWDNAKTLRNLQVPAEGSPELLESANRARTFVTQLNAKLNSNIIHTYSESEFTQVTFGPDGGVLSSESMPYLLIETHADHVVIDQLANGGRSTLYLDGPDSVYVEVHMGSFTFRDYFTRER